MEEKVARIYAFLSNLYSYLIKLRCIKFNTCLNWLYNFKEDLVRQKVSDLFLSALRGISEKFPELPFNIQRYLPSRLPRFVMFFWASC